MELEAAEKRNMKASKSKSNEVSNVADGNDDDEEKQLEELRTRFEQVRTYLMSVHTPLHIYCKYLTGGCGEINWKIS